MNMCRHHGIRLWSIQGGERVFFSVGAKDYRRLPPLAYKSGVCPRIACRRGFPFWLFYVKRNLSFFTGMLLFFCLLNILSSFVWEITYRGQERYSRETLGRTVEAMNVYPGMRRSRLNCDAIEKEIRRVHPDISWVSAEEKGSVLQISIKEGKEGVVHEAEKQPCHVTALYSGVVQEISVNRGTACVKKGDKVKRGQILISGIVPITDDSDTVTEKIGVAAKGAVTILVNKKKEKLIPVSYDKKVYTGRELKALEVELGGQSFSIRNPFKWLDNSHKYDIMTTVWTDRVIHPCEYPVDVRQAVYIEYDQKSASRTTDELKKEGLAWYRRVLTRLADRGMEVVSRSAVMRKQDEENWKILADISFLCSQTGEKPVTDQERTQVARANLFAPE